MLCTQSVIAKEDHHETFPRGGYLISSYLKKGFLKSQISIERAKMRIRVNTHFALLSISKRCDSWRLSLSFLSILFNQKILSLHAAPFLAMVQFPFHLPPPRLLGKCVTSEEGNHFSFFIIITFVMGLENFSLKRGLRKEVSDFREWNFKGNVRFLSSCFKLNASRVARKITFRIPNYIQLGEVAE